MDKLICNYCGSSIGSFVNDQFGGVVHGTMLHCIHNLKAQIEKQQAVIDSYREINEMNDKLIAYFLDHTEPEPEDTDADAEACREFVASFENTLSQNGFQHDPFTNTWKKAF